MDALMSLLQVLTVLTVGLVAGSEATTLIIHRTIDTLDFDVCRPSGQAVNHRMGSLMPLIMPITVILLILTGVLALPDAGGVCLLVAAALLVVMLLITFLGLAPLNKLEDGATAATSEQDWWSWRRRWMRLHSARVVCDVGALLLVGVATVL